jgi:hypothetical protein
MSNSMLLIIALGCVILLSIVGYWRLGRTDAARFLWTQIIVVAATILGVFVAAQVALADRDDVERRAAAAALNPYGTSSVTGQYKRLNNWMGTLENVQNHGETYRDMQADLDADFASLTPVDALAKLAENPNVAIHLDDANFINMQNFRVADEDIVRDIRALRKPEEFCKRLAKMLQYLQYLRRDWEWMNDTASRLTGTPVAIDFRQSYEKIAQREKVDWATHDGDRLDCH